MTPASFLVAHSSNHFTGVSPPMSSIWIPLFSFKGRWMSAASIGIDWLMAIMRSMATMCS